MEYILYCDESSQTGNKYGDFFGGCLIKSTYLHEVISELENLKSELNLSGELKWTKVTENYLEKYMRIMELFFRFIKQGKIKMRIMFRDNNDMPSRRYSSDEKYFKLYYQFIKHSFGFTRIPSSEGKVYVRIYLDQLPDNKEKCSKFKSMLLEMPQTRDFCHSGLHIRKDDIAEVKSHNHVLLQCADIVLGAMYFRLNNLHQQKAAGQARRGKRTVAKEKLYKHILEHINSIFPNFNIGVSTGARGRENPHWHSPYEHWKFIPK